MELKGKHLYGVGALVLGIVSIVFALVSWFINQTLDSTVQAAFAIGLIGIALAAWLEIDLLTRVIASRQARYGAETLVMILVFFGVIVLLNYILNQERFKTRWDLTEAQEHTLAPETLKVLNELGDPVKAVGFYTAGAFGRANAEEILKDFKANGGGNFDYEFVDPQLRPTLAQEYGVTRDGTLYVVRGTQREQVSFVDEASLTSALVRLNNPTVRVVYFLSGHGEHSVHDTTELGLSQIKTELESVNYEVMSLDVITGTIPAEASAVVIAGPRNAYSQGEVTAIATYLAGGGSAVIMQEPAVLMELPDGLDPLAHYLSQTWGITLRNDIVIDTAQFISQFGQTVPATVSYGFSPITSDLANVVTFFPTVSSLGVADPAAPNGVSLVGLVRTSPNAWGETNFDSINDGTAQIDDGEASGEVVVAASAESSQTKARVVVFGDSEFAINGFSRSGNGSLLLNAIKWATADDQLIGLTPKENIARSLNVYTNRDVAIVFLLGCLLPPLVVLALGLSVWWSRRRAS